MRQIGRNHAEFHHILWQCALDGFDGCFDYHDGTEYAREMKKGVFTIMHYLMPKKPSRNKVYSWRN